MLGNAPSELACKASAQPSAHPHGHRASESNAVLRTWKPVARHGPLGTLRRVRESNSSHSIDNRAATPVASRGKLRPRVESSHVGPFRRRSAESLGEDGVTYGFRSRQQTRSQRAGFTSSLTSQSAAVESNDVLSLFRRALNDHTSSRPVTRRGYDPRNCRLERPTTAPAVRAPWTADHFFCAACQGWSRRVESNHPDPRYE